MIRLLYMVACMTSFFASGCAHMHLAYDHVRQASVLTSVHEKQVLDNLAMFLDNPEALPFYAMPGTGSAQVTDNGQLSASPLNGPTHTVLGPLALSRNNRLLMASTPVTDPAKLKRMRCAYRRAIGIGDGSDYCIDCCKVTREFFGTGDDATKCCDCCSIQPLMIERVSKRIAHKPCEKAGHYCGTYIRVCPESYADFTRLVMLIMDYAANSPKAPPAKKTMSVTRYLRDNAGNVLMSQTYTAEVDLDDQGKVQIETNPNAGVVKEGKVAATPKPAADNDASKSGGLREIQELNILRDAAGARF